MRGRAARGRKGLYKGYLCGTDIGRAPRPSWRTADWPRHPLDELRRQGPANRRPGGAGLFAGSPGGPHSPEGTGGAGPANGEPAGPGGWRGRALYRPEPEGFLAFPCGDAGVSADALFCFCPRGTDEWDAMLPGPAVLAAWAYANHKPNSDDHPRTNHHELTALSDQLNLKRPSIASIRRQPGVHRGRSEAPLSAVCRSAPAEL